MSGGKVGYVLRAPGGGAAERHRCHWPGCERRVKPALGPEPDAWRRALEIDPDWLVSHQVFARELMALLEAQAAAAEALAGGAPGAAGAGAEIVARGATESAEGQSHE